MSQAEDSHWWYLGLRDAVGRCLQHPSMRLPPCPKILDAGCGTGGNIRFLNDLLNPSYIAGFDLSARAIDYASQKCPDAELYISDLRCPEIRQSDFDLIVSFDVLYTTGLKESLEGLRSLTRSLKRGGLMVWNLPAYNWLHSDHDRLVHTRERFTSTSLLRISHELGLECIRVSYRLFGLFPIVVVRRFASKYSDKSKTEESDLWQPSHRVNAALLYTLQVENRMIANGFSFPWGSSVFSVFKKL